MTLNKWKTMIEANTDNETGVILDESYGNREYLRRCFVCRRPLKSSKKKACQEPKYKWVRTRHIIKGRRVSWLMHQVDSEGNPKPEGEPTPRQARGTKRRAEWRNERNYDRLCWKKMWSSQDVCGAVICRRLVRWTYDRHQSPPVKYSKLDPKWWGVGLMAWYLKWWGSLSKLKRGEEQQSWKTQWTERQPGFGTSYLTKLIH